MFFAVVDRYRILNSMYRGHITSNIIHLHRALKIIMHTNYLYTKDHPQRTHEDMDLELDEVDPSEVGPIDSHDGTGCVFDDFEPGDRVEVWHARSWWSGTVTYKSRVAGTLSIRMVGARDSTAGFVPSMVRPI